VDAAPPVKKEQRRDHGQLDQQRISSAMIDHLDSLICMDVLTWSRARVVQFAGELIQYA